MENYMDLNTGRATELGRVDVPSVGHASEMWGKTVNGVLPIVCVPAKGCLPSPGFIQVPEGVYAIVQAFGADVEDENGSIVWKPGFHFVKPWYRVAFLITKQSFVFDTPVKGCKTADNVSVTIDVSLTVRIMGDSDLGEDPKLAKKFLYDVSPQGLARQLYESQEEAVRRLGRAVNYTEVYGLRSVETHTQVAENAGLTIEEESNEKQGGLVTDAIKAQLNQQFMPKGVQITDIAITNVRLPLDLTQQMQEKTTYSSVISEQRMKQQNDMQLLAMKEEVETANQKKREEQLEEESVGVKAAAEKQKELDGVEAETTKVIREYQEEEAAAVRLIKAKADLEVKEIIMEKEKILKRLAAEADAEARMIEADAEKFAREHRAKVDFEISNARSQALALVSKSEGEAAKKLRGKRTYELEKHQVQVLDKLSENDQVVVSGNTGDSLLAEMLVAQRQSQILVSVNADGSGQRATVQANR